MSLITWSWIFLAFYISLMVGIGFYAQKKIKHADDFATARGSYGPVFLAIAFAASTASGATFLGSPALSYEWGLAANWGNFLYPVGVYFGILISMRLIATSGNRFGNRSIPEYLGDRYQSEGIRVLVSLLSLVLFFYLAGQLVSGVVMFELMLGLDSNWALIITTVVLLIYVVLGGAHADILTDGVQGAMMLSLAVVVIVLTMIGFGIEGGFGGMWENLEAQDKNLVTVLNPKTPLYHSWWSIFVIVFAHMPLGLLPHLGNKLWALKTDGDRLHFVKLAFLIGVTLGMLGLGGLLARAHFGDALYLDGANPNQSLPMLFIELFPTWLAALIGVGVLSAIMSTADGLVVSSSQIIANDLYRRTVVPITKPELSEDELDQRVLKISRISTIVVLLICMSLAWSLMEVNVSLIVWIGIGGMMASFAGPLVVGALWRGVSKHGAYAGLITGFLTFLILHTQSLNPDWFPEGHMFDAVSWLYGEGPNPFSCAVMGEIVSISFTVLVSKLTQPLPESHLENLFGGSPVEGTG
ncbi:MAG TPA: sodium:solute symporter family protein [Pseudomonadales bacterium]|nr:sodium:pantothenate symporter [Gammaproteobacteria bacterium]MDP6026222.1 sodium:solute symporter family protein [Pseudomonadales bacterium]MDP7451286.1 sodium:solute symporter family protein [Arenicellales bacterium]MDP6317198.1 sodium:solute symporter family protein [Pseudomonadales bacterium]MDP7314143.1 sodium:solute symporter family protein [Pseudomonadales bacterium]